MTDLPEVTIARLEAGAVTNAVARDVRVLLEALHLVTGIDAGNIDPTWIKMVLSEANSALFVARTEGVESQHMHGRIVGLVRATHSVDLDGIHGTIRHLIVLPEFRQRHIGWRLFYEAEAWLPGDRRTTEFAAVFGDDRALRDFCAVMGFQPHRDTVFMTKPGPLHQ